LYFKFLLIGFIYLPFQVSFLIKVKIMDWSKIYSREYHLGPLWNFLRTRLQAKIRFIYVFTS